jgi:hypothetical protein
MEGPGEGQIATPPLNTDVQSRVSTLAKTEQVSASRNCS